MRIEDQHAQLRIGTDRLVQQQRDRRGLADAGRTDDCEMLRQHRGNMDGSVDAFVLRQLADDAAAVLAGIEDAHEVAGADAMRDGAEIGIGGDAAGKFFAAIRLYTDFAQQFHFDAEEIVLSFAPSDALGVHRVNEGGNTVLADADGDQLPHGPEFGQVGAACFGHGCNRCSGAIARDDATEETISRLQFIAAINIFRFA
ncbi:hypothetical protein RHSP_45996 [Rhizobium freirei PRF 81]|uniref:Uncharacterized protein n=1 Tax=Rhizobium freirei PRF 81 TaxID=363754 RepID=N6V9I9_9HYPH|nr:hypothetical protein RHSP_45996 [Rhizobium freirei PRF 81]